MRPSTLDMQREVLCKMQICVGKPRLTGLDPLQDLCISLAPEWREATQQYVHDHACAPDVCGLVVVFPQYLWADVIRGACGCRQGMTLVCRKYYFHFTSGFLGWDVAVVRRYHNGARTGLVPPESLGVEMECFLCVSMHIYQ